MYFVDTKLINETKKKNIQFTILSKKTKVLGNTFYKRYVRSLY